MADLPNNFFTDYEKILLQNISVFSQQIQDIYNKAIINVTIGANGVNIKDDTFNLDKYPDIKNKIQNVLSLMRKEITATINTATAKAWDLSNGKNDAMTKTLLGGIEHDDLFSKMPKRLQDIYFNRNKDALQSFQNRVTDGMNLSARVWDFVKPFQHELEAALADGIKTGRSAASLATDMKKYLNEPDKLFRRVRDENGNLQLSKAAKEYNPGQGVYRSSFKNAMRLTRTEINMGYRTSDQMRWMQQPFVLGVEIKLSRSHPKYDICDPCAGIYPKEFVWSGWHPQCLCYRVPVLANDEQNKNLVAEILGVKKTKTRLKYVDEMPEGFKEYYANNAERIAGWKNKPYWLRDNPEWIDKSVLPKVDFKKQVQKNVELLTREDKNFGTNNLFADPATGGYTAARLDLHEEIVSKIIGEGSTSLGTTYFLGGAPTTGKSSLTSTGLVNYPKGILKIDPEAIKAQIPEYSLMNKRKDPLAANKTHEESSKITKDVVNTALKKNFDIVRDAVNDGGFDDIKKKVDQQKRIGKKVVADYITTDVDVSLKRAYDRGVATGRFIPEDYLKQMHKNISQVFPELIKEKVFDELRLYDNNGAKGSTPKLILEQVGSDVKIYDEVLYKRFLDKAR